MRFHHLTGDCFGLAPLAMTDLQIKNLSSTMGREAIKLPAVPPKLVILRSCSGLTLFVLTNISLSGNVEITVRATEWDGMPLQLRSGQAFRPTCSHERLKRELQLTSIECNFQHLVGIAHLWRLLLAYFPLSQPLF